MFARRPPRRPERPLGFRSARSSGVAVALLFAVLVAVPLSLAAAKSPGTSSETTGPAPVEPPTLARPVAASPHPSIGTVDPYAFRQTEPAPMGVTDYGVTGASGAVTGYSYSTSRFLGTVNVRSTFTTGGGGHVMSFQLNVVVVLEGRSGNFSYWIQDVADVDTSQKAIAWLDNIWNLSASGTGGPLSNADLVGNGTVTKLSNGQYFYAAVAPSTAPGNDIVLSYPVNLSAMVVTTVVGGFPHVAFEYNDGFGWVTFDNVTFRAGSSWTDAGFHVDGFQYTPLGVFYDAEWDYAGSGSGQINNQCSLSMQLEFWNGHNFEIVPNAWNFGSNTAESLSNVVSSVATTGGGVLGARLVNGSGSLGLLYNQTRAGTLVVSAPTTPSGTVDVGLTPTAFVGERAVLTVAGGSYPVSVWNGSAFVGSLNVTVVPGQTTRITLPIPQYNVSVTETGLPVGTHWSVVVNGTTFSSATSVIPLTFVNGSYSGFVPSVPGYVPASHSIAYSVTGLPTNVSVAFSAFTFSVTFATVIAGDPTPWTVAVGGVLLASVAGVASTELPNGSYPYTVTVPYADEATPASGWANVTGLPAEVFIAISVRPGTLAGTVDPSSAQVWVDGAQVAVSNGAFSVPEEPGTYSLEVTASGYASAFANETVTAGNATVVPFSLSPTHSASSGSGTNLLVSPLFWGGIAAAVALLVGAVALRFRPRPRR